MYFISAKIYRKWGNQRQISLNIIKYPHILSYLCLLFPNKKMRVLTSKSGLGQARCVRGKPCQCTFEGSESMQIWVLNQKLGVFPPKWMVKIMENPIKMDDLGVPLFSETPIYYDILRLNCNVQQQCFKGTPGVAANGRPVESVSSWGPASTEACKACTCLDW